MQAVVWAAAVLAAVTVNAVLVDVVVLAAVAAASATVALPSLTCGAVAASFIVEPGRGSAAVLAPSLNKCLLKVIL